MSWGFGSILFLKRSGWNGILVAVFELVSCKQVFKCYFFVLKNFTGESKACSLNRFRPVRAIAED